MSEDEGIERDARAIWRGLVLAEFFILALLVAAMAAV